MVIDVWLSRGESSRLMKIWIVWGVSTLIYLGLNVVAIALKSGVPGIATMVGWGISMPILMTIGWWIIASSKRIDINGRWWLLGIIATGVFATAGIITVNVIGAIWASI